MIKHLLFCLLLLPNILSAQLTAKEAGTLEPFGFYQFLPPSYNASGAYKYPLIINMAGTQESGNGTTELGLVLKWGLGQLLATNPTLTFTVRGQQHAFVVLVPQMESNKGYETWQNFYIDSMINYARRSLNIDENKIFLTGYSLGGGGAWKYPTESLENANRIAGIIPVAPAPNYSNLCNIAQGKVAVWAHQSQDDDAIPIHFTDDAIAGINACSPVIVPLYSRYTDGQHDKSWVWAYDRDHTYNYPNVWEWMIGTSRANTPQNNQDPIAAVGNDITLPESATTAVLDGSNSYDPNDIIVKYSWAKLSGPASVNIENAQRPTTNITGLVPGRYNFQLTVTDQFGVSRADDGDVIVGTVLPVQMTYFKAKNLSQANILNWHTSLEFNASHFIIERSSNGRDFKQVGTVPAGLTDYVFTDANAPDGISYYRLKQVDVDGKFTLSKIVTVANTNQVISIEKFPNPVVDKLNIVIDGPVKGIFTLTIHDMQGKLVKSQTITKGTSVWTGSMSTGLLKKGVYSLQVRSTSGISQASKFLKD